MVADIGLTALIIAFFFSIYATVLSAYGGWENRPAFVESARNASLVVFPLLSLSTLIVIYNLYMLDFSQAYVYNVASRATATFLRITAL